MIALGVDPSTKKIAVAGLTDRGETRSRIMPVGDITGARRLSVIREMTIAAVTTIAHNHEVAVIVVEIPWANPSSGSSFQLLASAGVILEASQHAHPGAVVLERPTQSWKKLSVGNGNASKTDCLDHAVALGWNGRDSDIADALCMAQAAWHEWHTATTKAAA